MRFHVGLSFRLKHLKKFLIPIVLGLFAYFGFSGIFDNFLPLGFLQVYALENYDTTFNLSYQNYDFVLDRNIDSNTTYKDFFDSVINLNSSNFDLLILLSPNRSTDGYTFLNNFTFLLVPKESTSRNVDFYSRTSDVITVDLSDISRIPYLFTLDSSITNIYNSSTYLNFKNCYLDNENCNTATSTYSTGLTGVCYENSNNDSSNICSIPYLNTNVSTSYFFIYYSSTDLVFTANKYPSSSGYFYKKLKFKDNVVNVGDKFITYIDYQNLSNSNTNPLIESTGSILISFLSWLSLFSLSLITNPFIIICLGITIAYLIYKIIINLRK